MLARETAPGEDRTLLDILENSVARFRKIIRKINIDFVRSLEK